jgi:PAS domain-containing protein
VKGSFQVYAASASYFNEDEFALLTQLSDDISFALTAMADADARYQAEEQLRKHSQAVEQSPAAIVITDVTGAIEYVNPKFTELTGYTADEAIGQNPRLLKSGEMPAEVYQQLWQTILQGRVWHGEFHNRKKTASCFGNPPRFRQSRPPTVKSRILSRSRRTLPSASR